MRHAEHQPDHLALEAALIPQDEAAVIRTLAEEAADLDAAIAAAREQVTTAKAAYDRNLAGAATHHSTVPYAAYRAASQALSEAKADLRRLERQRAAQQLAEA